MTTTHLLAMMGPDAIILDTESDIVVAVVRAHRGGATNGDPPRLRLQVVETLRGSGSLDRRHAVWEPFPHDIDWVDSRTDEMIRTWEAQPLRAPPIGSKFILVGDLVGHGKERHFIVSPIGRFEFDEESYAWVRDALRRVPILRAERKEYGDAWTREFTDAELRDGARTVQDEMTLEVGQPILMNWATLTRGRVVALLPNGRVRVRPEGCDSRWDSDELRSKLLLYPPGVLAAQKPSRPGGAR